MHFNLAYFFLLNQQMHTTYTSAYFINLSTSFGATVQNSGTWYTKYSDSQLKYTELQS